MCGYDFAEQFEEINDLIRYFIRDVIFSNEDPFSEDHYSEFDLKFDFIKKTKCTVKFAENVLKKMQNLGLSLC